MEINALFINKENDQITTWKINNSMITNWRNHQIIIKRTTT